MTHPPTLWRGLRRLPPEPNLRRGSCRGSPRAGSCSVSREAVAGGVLEALLRALYRGAFGIWAARGDRGGMARPRTTRSDLRRFALALTVVGSLLTHGSRRTCERCAAGPRCVVLRRWARQHPSRGSRPVRHSAVAVAPDGKLVAAGEAQSKSEHGRAMVAVARFLPDGTPDATFGGDGLVVTQTSTEQLERRHRRRGSPRPPHRRRRLHESDRCTRRASTQISRSSATRSPASWTRRSARATGSRSRRSQTPPMATASRSAPGARSQRSGRSRIGLEARWGVARFTAAGVPDATFSGDGVDVVDVDPAAHDIAEDVAVQADGSIVGAGWRDHRIRSTPPSR